MSSLAPELGDAVRPDGTLKDASEIIWSYDADESIPFPLGIVLRQLQAGVFCLFK
jgi:hypothetical protein